MNKNFRSLWPSVALAMGALLALPMMRAEAQPATPATPPGKCESQTPGSSGTAGCPTGVIRPPATGDQGGVVTPPDTSQAMPMPVIPPPGSPGGDQSVQPK